MSSDNFQPQNRLSFASALRMDSVSKPDLLVGLDRKIQVKFSPNRFALCNLRTRRDLAAANLYRGFESFPLRHTVYSAEKSAGIALEIAQNGRNFAIVACKPD